MAILPGSGPSKTPESQPSLMVPPGIGGINQEPYLGIRRVAQLDNANRIAAQLEHDRGAYVRPPWDLLSTLKATSKRAPL